MQPYFLPYIGYFQLIAAVDTFVVFDDVNFINRGWINRNRMLLGGEPHLFTIPLRGASQNKLICDIELAIDDAWREKFLRTLKQSYARAPCYAGTFALLETIVNHPTTRLDEFLLNSIQQVMGFLAIQTNVVPTSSVYANAHLSGQDRIADICRIEGANRYINPVGGQDLYDRHFFAKQNTELLFLQSRPIEYPQGTPQHIPGLSILDVLMFNDLHIVKQLLTNVDFI